MRFTMWLFLLPRNTAIAVMKVYRKIVSPWYGDVCRYYPSCSRYALESYKSVGFIMGTVLTAWRLLRCNPWSGGGIDDPKDLNKRNLKENKHGFIVWDREVDGPLINQEIKNGSSA